MRLNIRLMGVLFGIMVLGLIGRLDRTRRLSHEYCLESPQSRRARGILAVGIGLIILGAVGVFFARMIKAGVSRQREFLADASAVQFTRQSDGIAGASKERSAAIALAPRLSAADPEEVSHMLFGSGSLACRDCLRRTRRWRRASRRLNQASTHRNLRSVDPRQYRSTDDADGVAAAFAGDVTTAIAGGGETVLAETLTESVGQPENEHIVFASKLRRSIPTELYDAAHSSQLAYLLCIALILDRDSDSVSRQFGLVREQLGEQRTVNPTSLLRPTTRHRR